MKSYVVSFIAVFVLSGLAFLALDMAVMAMQGLSLIYSP